MAACSVEAGRLETADVAGEWKGSFEGDDACGSGAVQLALDEADSGYTGTFTFETEHDWAGRVHATYPIRASLADGVLTIEQGAPYEADALPDWERWCTGSLELSSDSRTGGLEGSWVPTNCDCSGRVELTHP